MSLSDLELCKKIAEIVCSDTEKCGFDYSDCGTFMVDCNGDEFNPLTNKALLFDLMVKHDVELDYDTNTCSIFGSDSFVALSTATFWDKNGLPRAILECIVEASK